MTDRDALLRAIAANPDDDTPRLIYADLLDELGGDANAARARFIRVQLDLARNPGRSWFANSDRLAEAARLAGLYADRWLDELPRWAATEARKQRLRADEFPRGFLESFQIEAGTFAAQGNQLLDVAPITRIVATALTRRIGGRTLLHAPVLARVRTVVQKGYRPVHTVDVSGSALQLRFLDTVGAFGPRVAPALALRAVLDATTPNTNVDAIPIEVFQPVKAIMRTKGISQRAMAARRGTAYGASSQFSFAPSRALLSEYATLIDAPELWIVRAF